MSELKINILLIDDDEDAVVVTRHMLSSIRHWCARLDWASTYEQAIEIINRREHDVYLVDYHLDGRDGLELLKEAIEQGCRAPMIILTGLQDHDVDVQAMAAGAADYLVKDRVDAAHLERCIRYSLERNRLHEELEEKAQRLQSLASQLSHAEQSERSRIARILHDHLQQILACIKMYVAAMTNEKLDLHRGKVQELLDESIEVSRTLAVELNPPVLMDAGLRAGLAWLTNWMQQKHNLHIERHIDPETEPTADSVRFMLFHAVRELLFNVIKHARVDEARLTMNRAGNQLRITVEDDGAGFDAATLAGGTTSAGAFGLIHLRERVRLMGGELVVDTAPGRGCRVTLTAPRHAIEHTRATSDGTSSNSVAQAQQHEPDSAIDERGPTSDHRTIRVLLVDDHPLIREGLARALAGQSDIEVVAEAGDGEEALDLARRIDFDVVLMDIIMPRMNGFDATRQLRRQRPNAKVIGLSMYAGSDMASKMRDAGAIAYVSKGDPVDKLLEHIRGSISTAA